ncbi:hypothetical protein D3C80_1712580 [compost metagenome]
MDRYANRVGLAVERDPHIAFVQTVLQRIADQVLQQLTQPPGIPHTSSIALYPDRWIAFRVAGAGFGNRCMCGIGKVHGLGFDRQALAQATAHQLQ